MTTETHIKERSDAVWHHGRRFVPTIWGKPEGNTQWRPSERRCGMSEQNRNEFERRLSEIHEALVDARDAAQEGMKRVAQRIAGGGLTVLHGALAITTRCGLGQNPCSQKERHKMKADVELYGLHETLTTKAVKPNVNICQKCQ